MWLLHPNSHFTGVVNNKTIAQDGLLYYLRCFKLMTTKVPSVEPFVEYYSLLDILNSINFILVKLQ